MVDLGENRDPSFEAGIPAPRPGASTGPDKVRILRTRWIVAAFVALGFGATAACEDTSQIGSPLSASLTGPGTGLAGDSLPFGYDVAGRSLSGLIFEWGDGTRDSVVAAGAQTALGTRWHIFDTVGVYVVNMVVEDAVEGVVTDQVSVDVQAN